MKNINTFINESLVVESTYDYDKINHDFMDTINDIRMKYGTKDYQRILGAFNITINDKLGGIDRNKLDTIPLKKGVIDYIKSTETDKEYLLNDIKKCLPNHTTMESMVLFWDDIDSFGKQFNKVLKSNNAEDIMKVIFNYFGNVLEADWTFDGWCLYAKYFLNLNL